MRLIQRNSIWSLIVAACMCAGCFPVSDAVPNKEKEDAKSRITYTYGPEQFTIPQPAPAPDTSAQTPTEQVPVSDVNPPAPIPDGGAASVEAPVTVEAPGEAASTETPGGAFASGEGTATLDPAVADYWLALAEDIDTMREQLTGLTQRVERLEQKNNDMLNSMVSDLKDQNRQLVQELQRLYANFPTNGGYTPPPQLPAGAAMARMEPGATGIPAAHAPGSEPISAVATPSNGIVQYRILSEWGRTPEEAERDPNLSSQKNMVCIVPQESTGASLEALGKQISEQFKTYQNLNIQVFDDAGAAKSYYEQNAEPGPHRVLAVVKNKATTASVQVYRQETPAQPPATPAAPAPEASPEASPSASPLVPVAPSEPAAQPSAAPPITEAKPAS